MNASNLPCPRCVGNHGQAFVSVAIKKRVRRLGPPTVLLAEHYRVTAWVECLNCGIAISAPAQDGGELSQARLIQDAITTAIKAWDEAYEAAKQVQQSQGVQQ